ncbi:hypothetical protein BJ138DRAFT_1067966 [Hygrophoropsis aurantiaca]|uniref:Uncharacterized protein n=1 Tax=Hygrophoropsis aurantiaca TaxID=72124 RepID=A0ACB8A5Z7_9AGAM|nr:hypothetical protein BJ138DRAFT_1067966 [Hygrophoropsis aurantiaca]
MVKSVKEMVKDVKRRLSHHKHKHTDSATDDSSISDSVHNQTSSSSSHISFPSTPDKSYSSASHSSPRSRKISVTESRPRKLRKSFSAHSRVSSYSKHAMSIDTQASDLSTTASGTLVSADSNMSLRGRTISVDGSSSVAPGSDAGGDDRSLYTPVKQHIALAVSEETVAEIVRQPSELQSLPEDIAEVPAVFSPPSQVTESEVPDPFIIDDPEAAVSEEGSAAASQVEEIALAPESVSPTSTVPPNLNKDVPPPPDTNQSEEEVHDLYLPGLTMPTMFLPIPNTDPLTSLLTKYIFPPEQRPVRDVTGEWQQTDFHSMVMSNSWRALARMARDRLVTSNPENLSRILDLWYLRLSSLARLRLYNQTSAECTNLFAVLHAIEPPAARTWLFESVLPFELEVMYVRLKYWAGDHMGYLDALYALLRKCKAKAREARGTSIKNHDKDKGVLKERDPAVLSMWLERAARVCLIIASQLVEMKEYTAATTLLEPLCTQVPPLTDTSPSSVTSQSQSQPPSTPTPQAPLTSPYIRSAIARIHLQSGYIGRAASVDGAATPVGGAAHHFAIVAADPTAPQTLKDMNAALLASAEGEWARAAEMGRRVVEVEEDNYVAVNNLAVALLSQGKLKESIEVLESGLHASPAVICTAEPYLFNLSTLYELRSVTAQDKKRELLIQVAKWSGDGLKTTCLKMPST